MKRIKVQAYRKALIFKNEKLTEILSEGTQWIGFGSQVVQLSIIEPIILGYPLDLLLLDEKFSSQVDVINVTNAELVIQSKNGVVSNALTAGVYCYWKEGNLFSYDRIDLTEINIQSNIKRSTIQHPIVARHVKTMIVEAHEGGLLYVDQVLTETLSPGTYHYWQGPKEIKVKTVDLQNQQMEVNGQELLTKDKVAIRLNFNADIIVEDIVKALDKTKNFAKQLYSHIQLGVRAYISQYTLDELLANKTGASPFVMEYAQKKAESIGVRILNCGIRDVILPGEVRDIMNQVLIAEKRAQANVIMRREETASTRSLLNTAKLMEGNEMLFRLKEMEYMEKVSEKVGEITVNGGSQIISQLRDIVGYSNQK